jgi:glucan 1,3-beta-glucosidase
VPSFAQLFGPKDMRVRAPVALVAGGVLVALMTVSLVVAIGLVFDPRYRDFPFAPLTAAVVPFLVHRMMHPRPKGRRCAAEVVGGALLVLSAAYIAFNEGLANWQSLWLCAALAALAVNLIQARAAPD